MLHRPINSIGIRHTALLQLSTEHQAPISWEPLLPSLFSPIGKAIHQNRDCGEAAERDTLSRHTGV